MAASRIGLLAKVYRLGPESQRPVLDQRGKTLLDLFRESGTGTQMHWWHRCEVTDQHVFADELLDFTPNYCKRPSSDAKVRKIGFFDEGYPLSVGKQGPNGLILPFHDSSGCEQQAESDLRLPEIQPLAPEKLSTT